MSMIILSGDLGGTNSRLLLSEKNNENGVIRPLFQGTLPSGQFTSLTEVIATFLTENNLLHHTIEGACFGVAGPVTEHHSYQTASITNLPWNIDGAALANDISIEKVKLVNDFEATGYGVSQLAESDTVTLQTGVYSENSPIALIGAGTGLGVAQLIWNGSFHRVIASEGGHTDFAPTSTLQVDLLNYLLNIHPHVSYERLLSGAGIFTIYSFLKARGKHAENTDLAQATNHSDPAAAISQFAAQGDPLATQAIKLFIEIYGAQAGNLALLNLPRGGLYIVGGIAPKLLSFITSGQFMRCFNNKGRMAAVTSSIPVKVVTDTATGLKGAALLASRL